LGSGDVRMAQSGGGCGFGTWSVCRWDAVSDVVERVVQVAQSDALAGRCQMVVDATGVGRPVVDLLRRARPGCTILPVTITGGEKESYDAGYHRVPKAGPDHWVAGATANERAADRGGLKHGPALAAGDGGDALEK